MDAHNKEVILPFRISRDQVKRKMDEFVKEQTQLITTMWKKVPDIDDINRLFIGIASMLIPWVPEGFFSFGVLYKIPSHFEGKKYFSPLRFNRSLLAKEK